MQSIYTPIFDQIYELVKKQAADVGRKGHKIKVYPFSVVCLTRKMMFLVGGLGANTYLYEFMSKKLRHKIDVYQPESGYFRELNRKTNMRRRYGAIMKGAVLHKLGLNFIKERIMRRNYGIEYSRAWKTGDPREHTWTNPKGELRCNVMKWYATKVSIYSTAESTNLEGQTHSQWLCH